MIPYLDCSQKPDEINAFLTISDGYSRAKSSLRVTAYENVLGAPASARSTRKARTADLRPRFRAVDVLLEAVRAALDA